MRYFSKFSFFAVSFFILSVSLSILLTATPALAGYIRVAVLPWNVNGPAEFSYLGGALTDMISSRVGSNDVVEIVRKDLVVKAAGKYDLKNIGAKEAQKLGKSLEADFLLYGSISVLGEAISLDAKISNVLSGEVTPLYTSGLGIASVVKMARTLSSEATSLIRSQGASIKPDLSYNGKFKAQKKETDNVIKVNARLAPGAQLAVAPVADRVIGNIKGEASAEPVVVIKRKTGDKTLKRRSSNITGLFVSMTGADLDGDGFDEIFMISHDRLVVASFGIDGLKIIKEFSFPVEVQNLFLSSGDSDHDGKDEVYLASLTRGRPVSVSVKYNKGSYSIEDIKGLNYLIRAIDIEGEGTVLIAQDFRHKGGFFRKIIKIKKDGENYTKNGRFDIPKGIARSGISNFQFMDIDNDSINEILTLGKRGNIQVFKAGDNGGYTEYWRSLETYGGSLNELEEYDQSSDVENVNDDFYYMATPIKYGDFDSDGVKEIMLIRNIAGGLGKYARNVLYYKSGSLSRHYWNVAIFDEEWKTKDISGYIADFIISDLDGDGRTEVTMLVVENFGNMLKNRKMRSYLLSYSIK